VEIQRQDFHAFHDSLGISQKTPILHREVVQARALYNHDERRRYVPPNKMPASMSMAAK